MKGKYVTGVVWQDFQHKQLIELFSKAAQAGKNKTEKNLYRYTLAFLAMYVNHHFKLEEEYMEKYDYPRKALHQKEHNAFVKELKAFRQSNYEYSENANKDLLIRMEDWIMSHIMADDQELGKFILAYERKKNSL